MELRVGLGPLRLRSDDSLARRAVAGDERAFAAIFRRYHHDLYRYSLGIVGNPEDAQDALQATMFKAMRALPGESREVQLKPWLYRIAHNESVDLVRRRRRSDELEPDVPSTAPQPQERLEQRARLQTLLADLDDLPERQRGALVMRELSGLDLEEIAGAMQSSPAVVRQTIYEARTSLRQMEEGRDMGCAKVARALSDGDGRVARRRDVRAHLRDCSSCRRFRAEMRDRETGFAAIGAMPAAAATAVLQGVIGGKVAGSGISGSLAGAVGSSVLAKTAVTAAVVATVGASVAQHEGWVDLGLPGGRGGDSSRAVGPPGGAPVPVVAPTANVGSGAATSPAASRAAVEPGRGERRSDGGGQGWAAGDRGEAGAGTGAPATIRLPGAAAESTDPPAGADRAPATGGGGPGAAAYGQETAYPKDGAPPADLPAGGGRPEAPPGASGSAPGLAGERPAGAGTSPGRSGTAPVPIGSIPDRSGPAPGQSGATSGQAGTAPGRSSTAPGKEPETSP